MNKSQIKDGLLTAGIKSGDILLVHSRLSSVGTIEGGADAFLDVLLDLLGSKGTLVIPVYKDTGSLAEALKIREGVVFSEHPLAGVAALGYQAEEICKDHWKQTTAFGEGTPYVKIAELGGKVCLIGVDQNQNISLHGIEARLKLDYLQITQEYTFETKEGTITKSWELHPGLKKDFLKLDRIFSKHGVMTISEIGDAVVRVMPSNEMLDVAYDEGLNNHSFFLSRSQHCKETARQRAALSQGLIARENFTLVSATSLAGWYLPEMIDNLKEVGIDTVSIDMLQGKPVHKVGAGGIQSAVNDFRRRGCEVASLRLMLIPSDYKAIIDVAAENLVPRVVMPLYPNLEKLLEYAESKDVGISLINHINESSTAQVLIYNYLEKGYSPFLCFNGANFAKIYEKPFSNSYLKKLNRLIDQLDLEDCTFDGTPRALGDGNGDLKELISGLRCQSFTGNFVLTGQNRFVGTLLDSVKKFSKLLVGM